MSAVRLMFILIFVSVIICYCRCQILHENIKFDLFQEQPESFENEILNALKAKDSFWSGEIGRKVFQTAGAILKEIPTTHLIGVALPAVHALLLEDNSWIAELSKTLPLGVKREITINHIHEIRTLIGSIKVDIEQLKNGTLTAEVINSKLNRIDKTLYEIINRFSKGDSTFRPFPTIVLPTLFALASFVANFAPLSINLSVNLSRISHVPCLLAETIIDYFQPILSERLRQIKVDGKFDIFPPPPNAAYQAKSVLQPFRPEGETEFMRDSVRCVKIQKGKKIDDPNGEYLILRDELNKNEDYVDVINGSCVYDYLLLVRNRIETKFGEAFAAVNNICIEPIRNRTKTSTGNVILLNFSITR